MKYYYSTTLNLSFEQAIIKTSEALKKEGFGIVSQISMHERFKEKLDVDFKKYTILGACNPAYAYKALQAEEKIGTMLPCNVVVIEKDEGKTEVAAINPVASMMAVENPALLNYAAEVSRTLRKIIELL
jgi:uncharacterized protein (DUF302 family)